MRTVPALRELHRRFGPRGLVVVGIHTPEFERERDPEAVGRAAERLGIPYPIVLDDDGRLWREFHNRYWPATYLVGRDGSILWTHVGELHEDTAAWREAVGAIERALGRGPQPPGGSPVGCIVRPALDPGA